MKKFGRVFYRLIRLGILFLPPLWIGVRGAAFLRQCVQALASPGTGIDFSYEARKGAVLHITADSYSYLWSRGVLQVVHPRLQDSNGELLAFADSARVEGLKINEKGAINGTVRNLQGTLARLPNGHFALEDYLPEKTPQTENRPYHIRIDGVDIRYDDRSGKGKFVQRAVSDQMLVDGMGDNWIASGTLTLPGIGIANTAIQRYKNEGLLVSLDANQLNLQKAVDHFRTTPEGKDLDPLKAIRSDTFIARGPVRLFFPENKPFQLATSIEAHGTNVVYNGTDRFNTASFKGLITGDGASGKLVVSRGSGGGTFVGSTDWSHGARFAGQIDATVGSRSDIPPSLVGALPKALTFRGARANGWLSYDEKNSFRYDGDLNAQSLTVSGQTFGGVTGMMRAGNGLVRLEGTQGTWQGSLLRGNLVYYPADQKIAGIVGGPAVQLASVAKAAHISGLSGTAAGQALLSGTMNAPIAAIRASGKVAFRAPHAAKTLNGDFQGAGNYTTKGLDLTSLSIDTKTGTVAATGHADLKGALALNVAARGVSLSAFAPNLGGSASFSGNVSGNVSDPQVVGKAQVVGLTVADFEIPLVVADVTADKNHVKATSIDAARGAAQANGTLSYNFNTGGISGLLQANNLPLSEVNNQLAGIIDVPKATIGGTISNPSIDADLETHSVVVADRTVGQGRASFSLRGDNFTLPNLKARFAGGQITGSATGNIKTKQTHVEIEGKDLSIPDLVPQASETATLDGKVSGKAVLGLYSADIRYARASGNVADVMVNQTLVGGGTWSANAEPKAFSGAVQIGTLERYLDLPHLAVDRRTNEVTANFVAYHIPLQDIYSAAQRYIPEATSDVARRLLRVQGTADAEASVSGSTSDPNLKVDLFSLTNLSLEGKDLGQMQFALNKVGRVWTVTQADWNGAAGSLRSKGTIDQDKDIDFEGDFTNVDLGLLSIIDDNLTRIGGRAALSFAITGATRSPVIQASLDASRTTLSTGTDSGSTLLVVGTVLDTINISESSVGADGKLVGGIEASGKLFYRGLEGNLVAHLPLKYPLTLPQGDPLSVSLDFPQRSLQSLAEYLPALDMKRTDGTIQGNVNMTGLIGTAQINGQLSANAKTLGINKVQTTITDAVASVDVNSEALAIHLAGISSEGGTLAFDANSPVGDVSDRIKDLTSRGLDSLLDRPVNGLLNLSDFGIRYNGGTNGGRLVARTDGKITASGTLRQPAIAGDATISNVVTLLPSWDVTSNPPVEFPVDPTFNVALHMANVADVSTSLAKLKMIGDGTLGGTLNHPSVSSNLTVMGGTVALPTSSIRIEPGGTVRLRYQTTSAGETIARLDVDLVGHTSLTTLDAGDTPQHYDITLSIRGDLLTEGQTFVVAESDPPGLSQDRILALLGQADLIQALAGSVSSLQASRELRNALAGFVLPTILSPVTGAFAKGLGLDYLNISYDPLNQVSLSFAKEIGKNLSLTGTRQVSQPLPGIKPQFDLRMVYRLPFKGKQLRRTTISFGVDQDRPWKFGVQYGFRF